MSSSTVPSDGTDPPPPPKPSDYKGSQAFNNIITVDDESINPNTGSLIFSAPLFALKGVKPSVDLSVRLWYSEGTPGSFGLPTDWGLDLPFIVFGTNDQSLTIKTRTYVVNPDWKDSTGYSSGLMYVNDHGMSLTKLDAPAALPSGKPGQYLYKLHSDDGSYDFFDSTGRLLEHDDLYGNYIYYTYVDNTSQLQYILDSWGQQINFAYTPNAKLQVTLPDNNTSFVTFTDQGLTSITDPVGDVTSFSYGPFDNGKDNPQILTSIEYPSGAISRFTYLGLDYLDINGSAGKLPAVSDRYSYDQSNNILSHTNYVYGTSPENHTYTGFALGLRMTGNSDVLMDGTSAEFLAYQYDVLKTDLDPNSNPLRQTHSFFNHLHLSVAEIQLLKNSSGQFIEVYKDTSTYDAASDAHIVNYERPVTVESFHNTTPGGEPTYQPLKQTNFKYTEFGNATLVIEQMYTAEAGYTKQSTVTNTYQTTQYATQILLTSADVDEVSKVTYNTQNVPTTDLRDIASTILTYMPQSQQALPWKNRQYSYDPKGRVISETLAWSSGVSVPAETVSSVTYLKSYSEIQNGFVTQTDTDAMQNVITTLHDLRANTGPLVSKTLPNGQTETFQYDAVGRLTTHTDALKNVTTTQYSISKSGNWERKTTPGGYITLTTFDPLGREISVQDNGDPTQPQTDVNRYLSKKTYDALSRVLQSTDNLGLTTTYAYDSLGRPVMVIDPQNNTISYAYDDVKLQTTQQLNGDLRAIETLNGRMQVMILNKYADSSDASIDYYLQENTLYDGESRIISKTRMQQPKNGSEPAPKVLQTEYLQYGPESTVFSRTASGLGDLGPDTVVRNYVHDLFGNIYTYTKTTTYAGSGVTYTNSGPLNVYDANNRLAAARNQEGGTEGWAYDANGWLQQATRLDGSVTTYQYDAVGHNILTTYSDRTTTQTVYDKDYRIIQVIQDTEKMSYGYNVDGVLNATTYPDGSTQSYDLDPFSRVVKSTDALGVTNSTVYDAFGNTATAICQSDTVSYTYGTANHTNGKLIATTLKGSRSYQRNITYDGFDRISRETVQDPSTQSLLDTSYQIDGIGRLQSYTSASTIYPALNENRTFKYDGLNQVIADTKSTLNDSSSILYLYDGNSNVIQQETDGKVITMTYNKIDQRTDHGFVYDANGRMSVDNSGQAYTFDAKDQLIAVKNVENVTKQFQYYPDDSLASTLAGSDSATMYYDGKSINAMKVTAAQVQHNASIFRDTDRIVANYTDNKPDSYFLDRQGSTALLMAQDGVSKSNLTYTAYGQATASASLDPQSSFGFKQEFFDQISGLVYLQSRYYNPNLTTFISMDTYREENRYAYCKGDPINLIDANGHMPSWLKKVLAIGAGLLVSAAVVATAGLLAPVLGIGATAAGIIGGALGGAAGNIASGFVSAKLDGRKYTGQQALIDGLLGGIGGAAGSVAGFALGEAAGPVQGLFKKGLLWAGKKIVGTAASKAEQALWKPLITKEVHAAWNIGSTIRHGDPAGIAQIVASGRKSILSPQALATMNSSVEGTGNQINASQTVGNSGYHPYAFDSTAKTSGSASTPTSGNAAFDMSFSTSHDWTPSSMASIAQEVNKKFDNQWKSWADPFP